MRAIFSRLSRAVMIVALCAVVASALAAAGASHAQAAGPPNGTWACSVPAGYTWDAVADNLGQCNPTGFADSYLLQVPADNVWVCSVLPGYTWSAVANNLDRCNPSGFADSYLMRVPQSGIWVCWVPPAWTYIAVANNLDQCNASGFADSYLLPGTPPTTSAPPTTAPAQSTITANPATLSLPPNTDGTTVLTWNAPGHDVSIYLSANGTQQLFANGNATGSATAPWIMEPNVYVFNLYVQGYSDSAHLLASTTVRGVLAPTPPPTTTPPTTSPRTPPTSNPCKTCQPERPTIGG